MLNTFLVFTNVTILLKVGKTEVHIMIHITSPNEIEWQLMNDTYVEKHPIK